MIKQKSFPLVILLGTFLATVGLALISWQLSRSVTTLVRDEVQSHLNTAKSTMDENLKNWVDAHEKTVSFWANDPLIIAEAEKLLGLRSAPELLGDPQQHTKLRNWYAQLKKWRPYQGYFIIDLQGYSLSSSRAQNLTGSNLLWKAQPEYFEQLKTGHPRLSQPVWSDVPLPDERGHLQTQTMTLFIGAPIRNAAGNIIAILTLRLDTHKDLQAVLNRGRLAQTGEAYLVDKQARMASESRFNRQLRKLGLLAPQASSMFHIHLRDPGVNLVEHPEQVAARLAQRQQWPLTDMATSLLREQNGLSLSPYRDYRGVPVVGIWQWYPQWQLGVAIEEDAAEVYQGLYTFLSLLNFLSLLSILILLGAGVGLASYQKRLQLQRKALHQNNQILESSNLRLQQFAYIASHDLQTPLANIRGLVEILQIKYVQGWDEKGQELIQSIADSSEYMSHLIRDLLDYSRLEIQTRPFAVFKFKQALNTTLAMMESTLEETGAKVEYPSEFPEIFADQNQIIQILQNLIGNGVKYNQNPVPRIRITVSQDGELWRFGVQDNGIGIGAKHQEKIFEIFHRLHGAEAYPGTGIGLAICRRIIQYHRGEIWVESEENQGSVFYFTLPIYRKNLISSQTQIVS